MKLTLSTETAQSQAVDLLAVLVGKDNWKETLNEALGENFGTTLASIAEEEGFKGDNAQTFLTPVFDQGIAAKRVLLLGRGKKLKTNEIKELGGHVSKKAASVRAKSAALAGDWDSLGTEALALIAEGAVLGTYTFLHHKSKPSDKPVLGSLALVCKDHGEHEAKAIDTAAKLAEGVILARNLVNEPPNVCTPAYMAETAQKIADEHGFSALILNREELEAKGMNLLAAVGRGSNKAHESRFIHITYKGSGEIKKRLAFVGKGVTFDTGGYSIKPTSGMFNMHCDMAGGAAVLGAAKAVGLLQPEGVEVHFIVPSAKNMVGSDAFLLNEVITGYGKKTVEINNTDAEGRLLLADALAYASELDIDEVIDLATLTGACVVALGEHYSALYSNDEDMADSLIATSKEAGERLWQMPLDEKLRDKLKSSSADMKNTGDRWGGSITAALFLKEWIGDKTWTHLDIAGPAFLETDTPIGPRGGTGTCVATLARYASKA